MPNKKYQDLVDISFDLDSFTIFDDGLLFHDKEYPSCNCSSSVGPASTSTYDMNSTGGSSGGLTLAVPSPREQRDGSVSPGTSKRERSISMMSGRPPWVDVQMATRLKIPHTFVVHTYTKPTKCHFCGKMLVGVFKQVSLQPVAASTSNLFNMNGQ